MVKVGLPAPEFSLQGYANGETKEYTLAGQRGKWVVLFFYPLDFTFVCPTEIQGFSDQHDEFKKAKAEVFGVSVDSVHSHKAWVEHEFKGKLKFPLLSDFNKDLIKEYDIDTEDLAGTVALRGTFIIDPEGVLKYMVVSDNNVGRSVTETFRVLKALQSGGLCPIDWKPGEKTLTKK